MEHESDGSGEGRGLLNLAIGFGVSLVLAGSVSLGLLFVQRGVVGDDLRLQPAASVSELPPPIQFVDARMSDLRAQKIYGTYPISDVDWDQRKGKATLLVIGALKSNDWTTKEARSNDSGTLAYWLAGARWRLQKDFGDQLSVWFVRANRQDLRTGPILGFGNFAQSCWQNYAPGCMDRFLVGFADYTSSLRGRPAVIDWLVKLEWPEARRSEFLLSQGGVSLPALVLIDGKGDMFLVPSVAGGLPTPRELSLFMAQKVVSEEGSKS